MIAVISLFMAMWFQTPKTSVPKEQQAIEVSNREISLLATTNSPNTPISDSTVASQNHTNDIESRYRQGLISKGQAIQETIMAENEKPQDFYGKVIDQYGQPIVSANVTGTLILNTELYGGLKTENSVAQTDADGLFQFIGLHGADLNVNVKKDGYKLGERGEGYQGPVGEKSSPTDRVILTMWKLRGAEPLVSSGFGSKMPHDGTPITFDMVTGKESPDGDLRVTLSRSPLEVRRSGQAFDWTAKIEMLHGGLIIENDPYPFWAPESGYKSTFEMNISSNNVPWHSMLTQNFYITNSGGQYGRMQVEFYTALTPAKIKFGFTINPSGSQNLESDATK